MVLVTRPVAKLERFLALVFIHMSLGRNIAKGITDPRVEFWLPR